MTASDFLGLEGVRRPLLGIDFSSEQAIAAVGQRSPRKAASLKAIFSFLAKGSASVPQYFGTIDV